MVRRLLPAATHSNALKAFDDSAYMSKVESVWVADPRSISAIAAS